MSPRCPEEEDVAEIVSVILLFVSLIVSVRLLAGRVILAPLGFHSQGTTSAHAWFCMQGIRAEHKIPFGPLPLAYELTPYGWLRFGNNFIQLLHAIIFCRYTRARHIFVPRGFAFFSKNATTTTGTHIMVGKSFFSGENETSLGGFFYDKSFCVVNEMQWAIETVRHVYWQMFENITVDPDDIYLHVRGTDVMSNGTGGVPWSYGQPPCRYYTEAAIMHGNMSKMVVITDGARTPVSVFLKLSARAFCDVRPSKPSGA
jgi:hypothetical protein